MVVRGEGGGATSYFLRCLWENSFCNEVVVDANLCAVPQRTFGLGTWTTCNDAQCIVAGFKLAEASLGRMGVVNGTFLNHMQAQSPLAWCDRDRGYDPTATGVVPKYGRQDGLEVRNVLAVHAYRARGASSKRGTYGSRDAYVLWRMGGGPVPGDVHV